MRDTAIESSVVTKVKGFGQYANRVMDVSDYVTPPQVGPDAGSVGGEGERQEEGQWDSQTRICGISHPESPAWQLGVWGSVGRPLECSARIQGSRAPLEVCHRSCNQAQHTEGAQGASGWPEEPGLDPPPPFVSPVTLAKSEPEPGFPPLHGGGGHSARLGNWHSALVSLPSPPKGTSVFVIITKMIVTENQMQGFCPEVRWWWGSWMKQIREEVGGGEQGREGCGVHRGPGSVQLGPGASSLQKPPVGSQWEPRGPPRARQGPLSTCGPFSHRAKRSTTVSQTASAGPSASREGVSAALPTLSQPQRGSGTQNSTAPWGSSA